MYMVRAGCVASLHSWPLLYFSDNKKERLVGLVDTATKPKERSSREEILITERQGRRHRSWY